MEVNKKDYYRVFGVKQPRGRGYWLFGSDLNFNFNTKYYSYSGLFSEAKAAAIKWAKKSGLKSLYLLG